MPVEQRIRLCMLIERIEEQKEFSKVLGLEDCTQFHGERVSDEEEKTIC